MKSRRRIGILSVALSKTIAVTLSGVGPEGLPIFIAVQVAAR